MNVNGSDIEIEISASSENAAKNINALADAMSRLKESFSGGTAKYQHLAGALKELADAAKQFEGSHQALTKVAEALSRLASLGRISIPKSIGDGIRNIGEAAATITEDAIRNLDSVTIALQRLQNVDLKGVSSAMRVAKSKVNPASTSGTETELGGVDPSRVGEQNSAVTELTSSVRNLNGAINAANSTVNKANTTVGRTNGLLENFLSSLKRIAFYRIIRSIIKSITQAFQEGLQNAYNFSQGIETEGHRFAEALDSMKTASATMKNQLGSAFISLLAAIAPIINTIISLITRLAVVLSQIFAIFTGGTYLKAADVPQKWAEGAGGAAKAAKEWKNQLLGFDEINRLEEPSDGGGGGGGGGGAFADMFEDTEIDGIFKKIRDALLEFRDSLDFEPLKKAWNDLIEVVSRFADIVERRVGRVWNVYLKPLAKWTIEKGLPLVIEDLAKAFGLLLDVFEDLEPLINSFEDNVITPIMKWDLQRVEEGLKALGDVIDKIDDLNNGEIGYGEFFDGMGENLTKLVEWLNPVQAILNEITEWLGTKFWELFDGVKEQLGFSKQAWEEYSTSLKGTFDNIMGSATETWNNIVTRWHEAQANLSNAWKEFSANASQAFTEIGNNIRNAFQNAINSVKQVWEDFKSWIQGRWDSLKSWWQSLNIGSFHIPLPHLTVTGSFSINPPSVPHFSLAWYAQGGFPEDGLFMANHSELVGKFSNGKTAVANNEQIIEGIKRGVTEGLISVMGNDSNGSGTRIAILNVNGREFARAIFEDGNAVANEHGISLITA